MSETLCQNNNNSKNKTHVQLVVERDMRDLDLNPTSVAQELYDDNVLMGYTDF